MATTKTATKAAAPKAEAKPSAKSGATKAAAEKAPAKAAAKAPAAQKEVASGKVKITQIGSTIARKRDQEATLIGLGLNKRHRSRVLEDTPSVRGMINKVRHLVTVEKVS